MRKAFFALVLIIILAALLPFSLGMYTEIYIKRLVSNDQMPQGFFVELIDYERGYLRSTATYEISLYQPGATQQDIPEKVFSLTSHDEIQHGPLFLKSPRIAVAQIHSYVTAQDIDVSQEQQEAMAELFIAEKIFQSNMSIQFNRTLHINMEVSGIEQQQEDGNVQWGGLASELKLSSNLYKAFFSLDVEPLLLQADEKTIVDFSRITLVLDAHRTKTTPWVGEHDLSIASFFFEDDRGEVLRLDNFIMSADSTLNKNLANIDISIRAAHLEIVSEIIENFQLSASFNHLDPGSLLKIGEITKGEDILSPREKQELSHTVIYLFTPGSEITVNSSAHLEDGDAKGNITVLFPDVSAIVADETAETVAQTLVMNLEANLSYSVPMGTLEEILHFVATQGVPPDAAIVVDEETGQTMLVTDLIKQSVDEEISLLSQNDILLNDGENYTLHLGYDRGAIILNGSRLSQEDLARIMSIFNNQAQ